MAKVLVIDGEPGSREELSAKLLESGHEPLIAQSGREGLRLAAHRRPDLILSEVLLPDMSGTDVCRQLKAQPETRHIPLVLVSARGEEIDRVVGFELGAEDYIVKPFSMRELLLRVQAILRRGSMETQRQSADSGNTLGTDLGCLRIDRDAHRVWAKGVEIELTPIEFKLLSMLAERRNRVQSRAALLGEISGMGAGVTTRTVDSHVKRLREKLNHARVYIETVRGVGYRFVVSATSNKN